jgi:hypothetical protein
MTVNLQILSSAFLVGKEHIEELNTKELVPQMLMRRRLTQASKIVIEAISKLDTKGNERVICGSSLGELPTTASILDALYKKEPISPTDFQNSVYNTAVSYFSILNKNQSEMLTISSGDETSLKVLKAGALKALDGDELILVCFETINIPNIEQVNKCVEYLESVVALKVRVTQDKANLSVSTAELKGVPLSISHMFYVAQQANQHSKAIIEVQL